MSWMRRNEAGVLIIDLIQIRETCIDYRGVEKIYQLNFHKVAYKTFHGRSFVLHSDPLKN